MPLPKEHAWFPRKSYGWGWGIPSRWQGWVVMIVYLGGLIVVNVVLRHGAVGQRVGTVLVLSGLLVAIAYWKGEAPRWSWGEQDKDSRARNKRP